MTEGALARERVLDLSTGVAGPFCAKLLADYGAEVIKIEPPGGDTTRQRGPFTLDIPDHERSTLFLFLNSNKRGTTLDLSTRLGQRVLRDLAAGWATIIIESFPPGSLERWDLGYDQLAQRNPGLVLTSVTPFGQTGRYRDWQAEEIVSFAMSGLMNITGEPDRAPLKYFGEQAGYQAGSIAAVATLGAAWHARITGEGQHVDVSAMEAGIALVELTLGSWSYSGEAGNARRGNTGAQLPWSVAPCQDGWVVVGANQAEWPRVCAMMGMPELASDPRFATPPARVANQGELAEVMLPWLIEHSKAEIMGLAQAARLSWFPAVTLEDMASDPHLQARGFLVEGNHPVIGPHRMAGAPFKMGATPWALRYAAPTLGQHNQEVYQGLLGFTPDDLVRMRERGAI